MNEWGKLGKRGFRLRLTKKFFAKFKSSCFNNFKKLTKGRQHLIKISNSKPQSISIVFRVILLIHKQWNKIIIITFSFTQHSAAQSQIKSDRKKFPQNITNFHFFYLKFIQANKWKTEQKKKKLSNSLQSNSARQSEHERIKQIHNTMIS